MWAIDLIANVADCRFCTQGICAQFRTTRSASVGSRICLFTLKTQFFKVFHLLVQNTSPPNLHTMTGIAGDWEMVTEKVNMIS